MPEVVPVPNLTAVLNTEDPGVVFGHGAPLLSTSVAGVSVAGVELRVADTTVTTNATTSEGLPAVTFTTTFEGTSAVLEQTNVVASASAGLSLSFAGVNYTAPPTASKFTIVLSSWPGSATTGTFVYRYTLNTAALIKRVTRVGPTDKMIDWTIETTSPIVVTLSTFSVALIGPTQLERTVTVTAELDPDDARRVVFSFGFPYFAVGPLTYDSTVFVGTAKTTAAGGGGGGGGLSPGMAAAIAVPAVLGGLAVVCVVAALAVEVTLRRGPSSRGLGVM